MSELDSTEENQSNFDQITDPTLLAQVKKSHELSFVPENVFVPKLTYFNEFNPNSMNPDVDEKILTAEKILKMVNFIISAIKNNGTVLVYDYKGKSRSVSIVIAYGMKFVKKNLAESYKLVQEKCTKVGHAIKMRDGFKVALMHLDRELWGGVQSYNFFPNGIPIKKKKKKKRKRVEKDSMEQEEVPKKKVKFDDVTEKKNQKKKLHNGRINKNVPRGRLINLRPNNTKKDVVGDKDVFKYVDTEVKDGDFTPPKVKVKTTEPILPKKNEIEVTDFESFKKVFSPRKKSRFIRYGRSPITHGRIIPPKIPQREVVKRKEDIEYEKELERERAEKEKAEKEFEIEVRKYQINQEVRLLERDVVDLKKEEEELEKTAEKVDENENGVIELEYEVDVEKKKKDVFDFGSDSSSSPESDQNDSGRKNDNKRPLNKMYTPKKGPERKLVWSSQKDNKKLVWSTEVDRTKSSYEKKKEKERIKRELQKKSEKIKRKQEKLRKMKENEVFERGRVEYLERTLKHFDEIDKRELKTSFDKKKK